MAFHQYVPKPAENHRCDQWLTGFTVEGVLALFVFLIFIGLLPKHRQHTEPIHGLLDFFTQRDGKIMAAHINSINNCEKTDLNFATIKGTFIDLCVWLHVILNVASIAPKGGLQLYGPSVIKLGFSKIKANALNSISSYIIIKFSFAIS